MPAGTQTLAAADSLLAAGNYSAAITAYARFTAKPAAQPALVTGNAWLRTGNCHVFLEEHRAALSAYFNALHLFESSGPDERIAAACANISNTYYTLLDMDQAGRYIKRAEQLYLQLQDSAQLVTIFNDKALIERRNGRLDAAIELHHLAMGPYCRFLDGPLLIKHLFHLGSCYENSSKDSSLHYYRLAETQAVETEDSSLLQVIWNNMGDIYKEKQQYNKALYYLEAALALDADYGDSTMLGIIYHNLADTYDSLHQYENAYRFSVRERAVNEALYNTAQSKFAKELSEKYESGKKDEQIASQQKENRLKSRNLLLLLAGLAMTIALAVIAVISYARKRRSNNMLLMQNERIEKLNAALDASNQTKSTLFSVIGHDIRGPVSSMYAFLQMQQAGVPGDTGAFITQTEQLLDTLEDLLAWSKSQLHAFVAVPEKVVLHALVQQLYGLQRYRPAEALAVFENNIPQDLTVYTDLNMLSIILRNMLANAIKHAAPGSAITITASHNTGQTSIEIQNTITAGSIHNLKTPGFINSHAAGLGLTLMQEFAAKLNANVTYGVQQHTVSGVLRLPA